MKKVAILQSDYMPWKGYFDIINSVDEFIIYDEVQFTKNDWRNRNIIKGPNGLQWITIACRRKSLQQKINEVNILDKKWSEKHVKAFIINYSKATCFPELIETVKYWYDSVSQKQLLSEVNVTLIKEICHYLGINTTILNSVDFKTETGKNGRLIGICRETGANAYLTGPSAKSYIDEESFNREGIVVEYKDYSSYPEYKQLWPPFEHKVSIIDMIFNLGVNTLNYIKS